MSRIHTSTIRPAHAYTRSDSPWILEDTRSVYGRLIHYLSGGGLSTFGRTVVQEERRMRHRRFYMVVAAIGVVWCVFYVI